jgi:hypothetical protein
MSDKTSLAVREDSSLNNNLVMYDASEIKKSLEYVKALVDNRLVPQKRETDALAAIQIGKELNLPPMMAVNHVIMIDGKAGLDIHILNCLLLRAGVTTKVLKDLSPLYLYRDNLSKRKGEGDVDEFSYYTLDELIEMGYSKADVMNKTLPNSNELRFIRGNIPQDYITEVELIREVTTPVGEQATITLKRSFRLSEANAGGLLDKPNWKYQSAMMITRATAYAARQIIADLMMGYMTTDELEEVQKKSGTPAGEFLEEIITEEQVVEVISLKAEPITEN